MKPDRNLIDGKCKLESQRDDNILDGAPDTALDDLGALAAIIEHSDDAIIAKGLTGVVTSWNRGAEKLFGYTAGEMVGTSIMRLIPADRQDEEEQILTKIRRGESVAHFETVRQTKDGRLIHVSVTASPIKDSAARVVGISKVARDISGRKREEEIVGQASSYVARNRRKHIQIELAILVAGAAVFYVCAARFDWFEASTRWILTHDADQLDEIVFTIIFIVVGLAVFAFRRWRESESELLNRQQSQAALARLHEELGWRVEQRTEQLNNANQVLKAEIAERRNAEESLRAIIESSLDAILTIDAGGCIVEFNPAAEQMFGHARGSVIGRNMGEVIVPVHLRARHEQGLARYLATRQPTLLNKRIEMSALRADGTEFPIELTVTRIGTDEPPQFTGFIRDITERNQADAALRASEANMAVAQRLTHLGSWELEIINPDDLAASPLRWSDEMFRIAGYEPGAVPVSNELFFRLVPPADHEPIRQAVADAIREHGQYSIVHRLIRPDGLERVLHETAQIFFDEKTGQPLRIIGTAHDITERKQAEDALRLFRALVDQSDDSFEVIDPKTAQFIDVNEKGATALGFTRAEFLSLKVIDIDPTLTMSMWPQLTEQIRVAGFLNGEGQHQRKSGTTFPTEFNAKWVRLDRDYIVAVVRDITERKQAEDKLAGERTLLRTLIDSMPDVIFTKDLHGRLGISNPAHCRFAGGATEAELAGKTSFDLFPAELAEVYHRDDMEVLTSGRPILNREEPCVNRNGFGCWLVTTKVPLRNQAGEVVGLVGMSRNITERKQAEEALRESEQRLRQVVENIGEVFWMVDLGTNRMIYISPGYEIIWGRTCESLYASPGDWADSIHPEDCARVLQAAQTRQITGEYDEEYRLVRPDGEERWIRDRAFPVKDENGTVYRIAGVAADITERKKLEQQSLRAQRMESIGTLAGGIAHDLNNVLGPIIMSLDLLKMRFPEPESQELLAIVESSAQHGADMVRQILSFARGVEGRRMQVQIRHLIQEIEKIANDTFLKNIQVRTSIPHDLWVVVGDPTQLHQVLMNLCVNARDAMPDGGQLKISAENRTLDAHYAGLSLEARPGPYVFIQVEDNGTGMPPDVMGKIFDPFYTTKEVGKGTGLGLSTSMAIVKSHGGFMQVYSEMEKGTKFSVYLPAQIEAFGSVPVETAAEVPRGHGELILVVDDENSVRQITQRTLQAFGYRVVLASDGAEAVAIYATDGDGIAAVITDMTMPIMDGIATIRVLLKMNPAVRIVGTSGLSSQGYATQAAALGVKHFLPKPYTAELLLKVLNEMLTGKVASISE